MTARQREYTGLLLMLLVAGLVFCAGITWGLPSRGADTFLFGPREPWTGEQILALTGGRDESVPRGADVDRDPLSRGERVVVLNATDADRAEILTRYRLYTHQPDEMITMMALASMRPGQGDLDPRLYQYGGLWIYPVGALLKLGSVAGLLTLRTDLAWYLDRPEEFGRFYIAARLYVVLWALIGLWAVFRLTLRLSGGCVSAATVAGLCCTLLPIVVNMAHEAKPHLPGAVLCLLAVLAGVRYVESGQKRWWLTLGVLCGAAFGMVLSALPVFALLPVAELLRRQQWQTRILRTIGSGAIGALVYLVTNPYVAINWFANREVLQSNFGNSLAMYEVGRWGEGVLNAAALVGEGMSAPLAVFGAVAAVLLTRRVRRVRSSGTVSAPTVSLDAAASTWLLLLTPVLLILVQFTALAAGKPAEYARFAILPDMTLAIAAVVAVRSRVEARGFRHVAFAALLAVAAIPGLGYLQAFVSDRAAPTSRTNAAGALQVLQAHGVRTIGVHAEPAPYVMPPFDLFAWEMRLLPAESAHLDDSPEIVIAPAGETRVHPGSYQPWPVTEPVERTPVSWASKRFRILVHAPATEPAG